MSIVITLGVTTPETSYTEMAAGSDPESVEASPAVNTKNFNSHSCGSAQSHGYRGLPYADHNYGAPPPPTPPTSPLSQIIIPRMDRNGVVRSSRYIQTTEDNSPDSDSSSEEDGAIVSWCHCTLMADGSLLIKCDNCRGLDGRKGTDGQHRRNENVSAGESSATESGDEEVSPSTISYTATQHTPTSIKLTVNRVKRSKSKKRKKNTEKASGTPKGKKVKAFREGSRKSMRMKNSTTDSRVLDENTTEGWENRIRQWTDQYEEALANQYSADVQTLLQLHRTASTTVGNTERGPMRLSSTAQTTVDTMDTINRTELACNNTVLSSQMQLQLGRVTRVQKHRKILRAAKNLDPDILIIEYRGKVMLKQQFEVNGHFFKKPYPFVLFYSKFHDVEMCVDARTFGNDARFIRRSCTPNAEVRHMIAEGMVHLCIYAISQIPKDTEVTIGFDYEFNSCNYKVDCACHKENQNCPVQKHMSPKESLPSSPSLPSPSPLVGAETRQRKARRRELEVGPDSNQTIQHQESKELQRSSHVEGPLDEITLEEAEEGEVDENGILISNKILNSIEKRQINTGGDIKEDTVETEEGTRTTPIFHNIGVGVSTRRTVYVTEAPSIEEKASLPHLPVPFGPPKPIRSSKPRPKSRMSRYRSSSSQRARRQRQALAQQAAAAAPSSEQIGVLIEEGSHDPYGSELCHGESGLATGHLLDGNAQSLSCINRGNLRFPKTKKYLVTEWLNEKIPGAEKLQQELPIERPLRITTDPTVLATTLNMLPGISHSSVICTTPRHYVRFGSPFNPERRRPRPLQMDGSYGCFKKRWIKQMEVESCSNIVTDGTESTSSQQSTSNRSTPNPLSNELNTPFKKRHAKYMTETMPTSSDDLLRPLSPITPPIPGNPVLPVLHNPRNSLLSNGLAYSPMPTRPVSRCNTPLQFENISSPEASPARQPESISPETDFDIPRAQFPDLSLSSILESPMAVASDDFCIPGSSLTNDCQDTSVGIKSFKQVSSSTSDQTLATREQAFRTEFNLIYTCSPLNANLGNTVATERRFSQSDGGFSPGESLYNSLTGQGLFADVGPGCMSPYSDLHYGGGYPESSKSPHTNNPPQKKKRANQHTISLLTGKPVYQAIAVRSEYKPVRNMVSLFEYRKRKQVTNREPESSSCNLSLNCTPTRPGSHHNQETHPSLYLMHPLASTHNCMPSSGHTGSNLQKEEVSLPDHHGSSVQASHLDRNTQWMVPTSVERLREGQGALEQVLKIMKMERMLKRSNSSTEKESDADQFDEPPVTIPSPMKSPPHRYSPSVHSYQSSDRHQTDSPSLLQKTPTSPFGSCYSPTSGNNYYHPSSHTAPCQDHLSSSYPAHTPSTSSDSKLSGELLHLKRVNSDADGPLSCSRHLKVGHLNESSQVESSIPAPWAHELTKTDLSSTTTRGNQQQDSQNLKSGTPSSRLLSSSGPTNYSQRGISLSQFQRSPRQGPGVQTQSGSF
ncbi:histone-lysine N-methyltransferase SETD5 isoform X3 [Syngnathoides biaculeatus]|uniref:histone-lysine N-methyltransferase SETD5 isoform X3 n=1 Tax=Syngnathoides biaculeatus TaxID=300417 RepID=UPI002ADDB66B|nr:histone-lysine N-methyltransferase SETD5 isoform X3 [Syngnathoides biaculeatus]